MSYKHGQMNQSNLPSGRVCPLNNTFQNRNTNMNSMPKSSCVDKITTRDISRDMPKPLTSPIKDEQMSSSGILFESAIIIGLFLVIPIAYGLCYYFSKKSKYQKRCEALVQQMNTAKVVVDLNLWDDIILEKGFKIKYDLLLIFQKIIQTNPKYVTELTMKLAKECVLINKTNRAKKKLIEVLTSKFASEMSKESRIEIENAIEQIENEYDASICKLKHARRCRALEFKRDSQETFAKLEKDLIRLEKRDEFSEILNVIASEIASLTTELDTAKVLLSERNRLGRCEQNQRSRYHSFLCKLVELRKTQKEVQEEALIYGCLPGTSSSDTADLRARICVNLRISAMWIKDEKTIVPGLQNLYGFQSGIITKINTDGTYNIKFENDCRRENVPLDEIAAIEMSSLSLIARKEVALEEERLALKTEQRKTEQRELENMQQYEANVQQLENERREAEVYSCKLARQNQILEEESRKVREEKDIVIQDQLKELQQIKAEQEKQNAAKVQELQQNKTQQQRVKNVDHILSSASSTKENQAATASFFAHVDPRSLVTSSPGVSEDEYSTINDFASDGDSDRDESNFNNTIRNTPKIAKKQQSASSTSSSCAGNKKKDEEKLQEKKKIGLGQKQNIIQ